MRAGTHWVELRRDGLYQHEPDSEGRGMVAGRGGGWMHMTLRHPYGDHQLRFDQHARPYRAVDVLRLEYPLRHLIDEGKLRLLGDPEWVGDAVAHLVGGKNRWITSRALRRTAAEAATAAGPASL
ncbi:hypothetical protein ACFXKY_32955 [Streptomyces canus]|uniref:hypothetical protein n=1 Tax=Streptomyces canus TaxID=58343 RepID=UPI0036B38C76